MFSLLLFSHYHVRLFVTPWAAACQASLFFTPPRACSNSRPLSEWCNPTISSSVTPFSSSRQSFPTLGSFLMSQLFASGGESIYWSFIIIFPVNIQGWLPLRLTGLISLLSKALFFFFFCSEFCHTLGRPRGSGWWGRWVGGSGWGTHV